MTLKQSEVTEHQGSNSQSIAQLSWLLLELYDTFCKCWRTHSMAQAVARRGKLGSWSGNQQWLCTCQMACWVDHLTRFR